MKIFVAYDTKYGNTKLAAENLLKGIREASGVETAIGYVKEIKAVDVAGFDAIILGAPNHMGRPSRTKNKFVHELAELDLKAKYVAVFGTYAGRMRDPDRAVKKLEIMAKKRLPKLSVILAGLSAKVNGVTGPLVDVELPRCVEFGRQITSHLKGNS